MRKSPEWDERSAPCHAFAGLFLTSRVDRFAAYPGRSLPILRGSPTMPHTPLPADQFRECLRARERAVTTFHQEAQAIQLAYEAALAADFRQAFPRRTWSLRRAGLCPNRDALHDSFQARADMLYQEHQRQVQEIDATLDRLAATIPVRTCEPTRKVLTVSASSYSSQGYGASRYAEQHAQMVADTARYHGLTAEVKPEGPARSDPRWRIGYQDYAVWVNTDEDGWELLEHKPDIPLKEWVRLCWKRQVNPRVYNPWLPPDLEERLGLDHFGHEVRPGPPTATIAA